MLNRWGRAIAGTVLSILLSVAQAEAAQISTKKSIPPPRKAGPCHTIPGVPTVCEYKAFLTDAQFKTIMGMHNQNIGVTKPQ
jgi:hypothetical protein